jgi:hypothetical protein
VSEGVGRYGWGVRSVFVCACLPRSERGVPVRASIALVCLCGGARSVCLNLGGAGVGDECDAPRERMGDVSAFTGVPSRRRVFPIQASSVVVFVLLSLVAVLSNADDFNGLPGQPPRPQPVERPRSLEMKNEDIRVSVRSI